MREYVARLRGAPRMGAKGDNLIVNFPGVVGTELLDGRSFDVGVAASAVDCKDGVLGGVNDKIGSLLNKSRYLRRTGRSCGGVTDALIP